MAQHSPRWAGRRLCSLRGPWGGCTAVCLHRRSSCRAQVQPPCGGQDGGLPGRSCRVILQSPTPPQSSLRGSMGESRAEGTCGGVFPCFAW